MYMRINMYEVCTISYAYEPLNVYPHISRYHCIIYRINHHHCMMDVLQEGERDTPSEDRGGRGRSRYANQASIYLSSILFL
jgi:hypothetical protein